MLPGEHLSVEAEEQKANLTEGSTSLKSAQEILSVCDPVSRGNTITTDLICSQPLPAVSPPAEASREKLKSDHQQKPVCPRCSLTAPDEQGSGLSVRSGSSKRRRETGSVAGSHQTAAAPADSCFRLLLACLWCHCSTLLLGLLEVCASCLHALCSTCCRACSRCCSAVQEAPVEEFTCHAHCHSVLFQSCCEPTECLEFCLECCEICHRS
ncbi:myoD family inhibitor domain-containing protein-like [Archocentrus centrarchus]|uniref:myoD family inhibitor domain-containing protein-like n=1 Tax=Archocentrus centrarchus TaxID=63155 RepID=UPI0011E9CB7D|nr:myoD family inhibitor domain-containing protein-like [Archocentrus centrarchus]